MNEQTSKKNAENLWMIGQTSDKRPKILGWMSEWALERRKSLDAELNEAMNGPKSQNADKNISY